MYHYYYIICFTIQVYIYLPTLLKIKISNAKNKIFNTHIHYSADDKLINFGKHVFIVEKVQT